MDAERRRNAILGFLGLSLLLHFFVLYSLKYIGASSEPPPPSTVFIDLNTPPPATTLPTQTAKPKQVAESEISPDVTKPKEAKYLGERDQSVEEETRAKQVDSFRKGGAPTHAGHRGQSLSLKDLAPKTNVLQPPTKAEMDGYRAREQKLAEAARAGEQSLDNAGSATNDYLKNVKDGDRTMLNTKEFVYFGYYRRIREKLEAAWNTRLRNTLDGYVYGGRQLAGNRDYVTGLIVVLDRNGNITRVQVLQQSGARDLDQAAIDAFNSAGPFPDPPAGLVDEHGEIQIPWNFILQS